MAKENPLRSLVSHVALASSTLIGIIGVLSSLTKYFAIDQYLTESGLTKKVLFGLLGALIAAAVTVFVDRAIVKKKISESNDN